MLMDAYQSGFFINDIQFVWVRRAPFPFPQRRSRALSFDNRSLSGVPAITPEKNNNRLKNDALFMKNGLLV